MPKIPKNLSDKEMFAGYAEEATLEERFIKAEEAAEKKRKEEAPQEPPADFIKMGFTPELAEELGKTLTALRIELSREGIRNYGFKIRRDGRKITLTAEEKSAGKKGK